MPYARHGTWLACVVLGVAGLAALFFRDLTLERAGRKTSPPCVELEPRRLAFGTQLPGSQVSATVKVTNRGSEALDISALSTSCGCAPASIDRTRLAHGEEATLSITFHLPGYGGQVSHRVMFRTNDPIQRLVSVPVTAVGEWPVEISPLVLRFGEIPITEGAERGFEVYSPSGQAARVGSVAPSASWITVRRGDAAEHRVRFVVTVRPPSLGQFHESLVINTGSAERPTIILPVEVEATRDLQFAPKGFLLGRVHPGGARPLQICIRGRKQAPSIERVALQGAGWRLRSWGLLPTVGTEARVEFEVLLPEQAGYARASLAVHVEGETEPISIPIRGIVAPESAENGSD